MSNKKQVDEEFKLVYDTYFENINRFCNVKLKNRNEAQDCIQECFTVYYKRLLQGEKIENPGAYLYKIADNIVNSQFRRDKKQMNFVDINDLREELYVENMPDYSNLDYDMVAEKIIKELNTKEKELYELRYINKKSLEEISQTLNISFTAVAQRLFRLREKVKKIVNEEMKGDGLF